MWSSLLGAPARAAADAVVRSAGSCLPAVALPNFGWCALSTRGTSPPPSCCHSLVSYQDKYLILFGGGSTYEFYNQVFVFSVENDCWSAVETHNSSVATPRLSHSAVVYKNKMIVYGGQTLSGLVLLDDIVELDLQTWTWAYRQSAPTEPDGPGERRLHSAHIFGDRMYVMMGDICHTETCMWYLDLLTDEWHAVAFAGEGPPFALSGHASAMEGDTLYVFGGHETHCEGGYSNQLYLFDFRREHWRRVATTADATAPMPRYAGALAVKDGRVYVFGGDANREAVNLYFDDLWHLDTRSAQPTWSQVPVPDALKARSGASYAQAQSALYCFGGELCADLSDTPLYSNELWRYPLAYDATASVCENTARWLGAVNANAPQAFCQWPSPSLPNVPWHLERVLRNHGIATSGKPSNLAGPPTHQTA